VTSSQEAVQTHGACPGHLPVPLPPTRRAHTSAGWGHGGTRYNTTSRKGQTWSVHPAALAGVRGCHCLAEPVPLVGRGCGKPQPGNYTYRSQIFTRPNHRRPWSPASAVWTDPPACRPHSPCSARSLLCGPAATLCRTAHSGSSHQLGI